MALTPRRHFPCSCAFRKGCVAPTRMPPAALSEEQLWQQPPTASSIKPPASVSALASVRTYGVAYWVLAASTSPIMAWCYLEIQLGLPCTISSKSAREADGSCTLSQVTQRWTVPAAAGPGPRDLSTVAHSYSSTVDPVNDFYSGLFGMSMVAAKGALLPDGLVCGCNCLPCATCLLSCAPGCGPIPPLLHERKLVALLFRFRVSESLLSFAVAWVGCVIINRTQHVEQFARCYGAWMIRPAHF